MMPARSFRVTPPVTRSARLAVALLVLLIFWTTFSFPTRWDSEYQAVNSSKESYSVGATIEYICILIVPFLFLNNYIGIIRRIISGFFWSLPIALALLSTIWTIELKSTLFAAVGIILIFIICAYISSKIDEYSAGNIVGFYCLFICLISIIIAIVSPQYGIMNTEKFAGQLRGIYSHKNFIGENVSFLLLYVLITFFSRRENSFAIWSSILIGFITVIWSFSVTSIIMLIISISLIISFRSAIFIKFNTFAILTLMILAIAFSAAVIPLVSDQILGFFGKDSSLTGRDLIWRAYIELGSQRDPIGWGYKALVNTDKAGVAIIFPNGSRPSPHNSFISLYCDLGYPGLAFYGFATIFTVFNGIRRIGSGDKNGLYSAIYPVGYSIGSFTEGTGGMSLNVGFVLLLYIAMRPRYSGGPLRTVNENVESESLFGTSIATREALGG